MDYNRDKGGNKIKTSVSLTPEGAEMLKRLQEELGINASAVVEMGIRRLHRYHPLDEGTALE